MEVFPNLHWIETRAANVYLYVEADGLTLVDTANPGQEETILGYVETVGRKRDELKHILITHADWDHAGSAAAIQSQTGATVYAGTQTAALLQQGKMPQHLPRPVQFILDRFIGYPPLPATAIQTVAEGDTLPIVAELQVLATPGHSSDHHSFYSPTAGVLFAGDALSTRGGELKLSPGLVTGDGDVARISGRRLLALAPALFACGHGAPLQDHTLRDVMTALQSLK